MEEIQVEEKKVGESSTYLLLFALAAVADFSRRWGICLHPSSAPVVRGPSDAQCYEGATYPGLFLAPNFLDHGGRRAGSQKILRSGSVIRRPGPQITNFPNFAFSGTSRNRLSQLQDEIATFSTKATIP